VRTIREDAYDGVAFHAITGPKSFTRHRASSCIFTCVKAQACGESAVRPRVARCEWHEAEYEEVEAGEGIMLSCEVADVSVELDEEAEQQVVADMTAATR